MSGCLTERTLMLLRADEGGAEGRAHLRACRACAARYRELEEQLADPSSALPASHRWFYELIKTNLAEDANERYFSVPVPESKPPARSASPRQTGIQLREPL